MKTHTLALYEKQKKQFIAIITLSAGLLFLLSTVVNLAMWRISGQPNFLWNSIGLGACAVLVGLSYGMERAERVNTAALLLTLSWGGYFLVHSLFWANVTSPLLVGLWILPTLLLVSRYPLPKIAILLLTLAVSIILIWLNQTPFFPRLATTDISLLRFVVPSYVAIFGLFVLPISLFGFHQRKLFVQLLFPILVMVATPIVILAINTHYNTMMSETQATQRLLDQILKSKNDQIQSWLLQQKNTLENLLQEPQSYARLLNLLTGSEKGTQEWEENFIGSIILLQRASETSDFEEIYLFNKKGIVLASSETGLIGENFEYQEFFWQGEIQPSIIPPRYYAPANQVSLFISLPIYDSLNNLVGVLSGRATIRPLLAIFYQPPPAGYQSLRFYWLGADSNVILSMQGKPNLRLETEASRNLLVNQAEGTGIYKNADGTVVIGAYLWNDDLKSGLIAEVTQNEIYRPLTALLLTNLGIALGAFVLTSLASWLIVQAIIRPINSLVEGYRQVTAGKLDTYVETEREDEIGILTQAFNNTTIQLKTLVTELEKRVEERTKALEERTLQLRTAAQIARDTAFANRLDDLLDRTVTLISERFGFYHTGIFLNDDKNEFAVLRSASSEAGKVMLANQHKLPLGTGLVGHVAKWGQPRIALDVGEDAAHFRNPLLPYTRSEMALPIQTRGRILGVLDIQSEKAHAFDQNDVQVMQIITDQLAVAIEKIRLLEELQESSRSLERALRIQTAREWREFIEHIRHHRGYRYEGTRIEPLAPELIEQFQRQLNKQAIISTEKGEKNSTVVHVPILLRGQILGGLSIRFNAERIPAETVSLIEETANRLALALENARLLQDAQRLANREQQINLIASQLQRANEIDALLQSAVRELGKVLDVPRSFIQIGFVPSTPDTKDSSANR